MSSRLNGRSLVSASSRPLSHYAWIALIWVLILAPVAVSFVSAGVAFAAIHAVVLVLPAFAILLAVLSGTAPRGANALGIGAIALVIGPILSSIFGIQPGVSADTLRILLYITAASMLAPVNLKWFVTQCQRAIAAYALLTVATAIIMPARVVQFDYAVSWMPALPIRLEGMYGQPNNFAALLAVYLILGWFVPARTMSQRAVTLIVVGCLIATQSKTMFVTVAILYALRLAYLSGMRRFVIAYACSATSVLSLLLLSFLKPQWDEGLIDQLTADSQFTTMTGRTDLWTYTLEIWRLNPVFGYGPNLWGLEMGRDYALRHGWAPGHAHNQVVQTLGESGLIGLAGLFIFLAILVYHGVRSGRVTNGATTALVSLLLIRSLTEPIIRGVIGEILFVLFVTFAVLRLAAAVQEHADTSELVEPSNR